jgi:hypothetical protein
LNRGFFDTRFGRRENDNHYTIVRHSGEKTILNLYSGPVYGRYKVILKNLKQIEKVFTKLSEVPERGTYPKELLSIGIREYRAAD